MVYYRMLRVRLLLLLFCSVALLRPGAGFGSRRLCGVQLVEALLLVCGDKGLFYQSGRRGRDEDIRKCVCVCVCVCVCSVRLVHSGSVWILVLVSVMMTDAAVSHQVMRKEESAVSGVIKRGIVEQCCHFSCDYYDLENYCNI
ncbi:insulin [Ictalurus furcatus]|uniref:insulin n=1 Tax=Ictalurus furcatus TaxID=66913 RepID=UPI002350555D|nr:insulin [Ictalurus furcatus]